MIDLSQPLDIEDPQSEAFLSDVQGNTIKGHSRKHGRLFYISIDPRAAKVRHELAALGAEVITSAREQREQTLRWKRGVALGNEVVSDPFGSIAISHHGYEALSVPKERRPGEAAFRQGMKPLEGPYSDPFMPWDPRLDLWQPEYKQEPLDLMVLLADDDRSRLGRRANHLKPRISRFGSIIAEEIARQSIQAQGRDELIEHFGFRDGVSLPKFIKQESKAAKYWPSGGTPLDSLFVEEPNPQGARDEPKTYGSYVAYLKLEQNVQAFESAAKGLAKAMGVGIEDAKALAIGRRKDGQPLVTDFGRDQNDFDYRSPANAAACPAHAHIRRMNVRSDSPFSLARRSMFYGPDRDDLRDGVRQLPPSGGVGLLFMSYQASIKWFAGRMFAALEPTNGGVDALIGRSRLEPGGQPNGRDGTQTWRKPDGSKVPCKMADYVTARGGEYFFCPSLSFFRNLPNF